MRRAKKQPTRSRNSAAVTDPLFQMAFHNRPVQSVIRVADTLLAKISERFTKGLGHTREEVVGKTPFEQTLCLSQSICQNRHLLEKRKTVRDFEMEVRAKGGNTRTVLSSDA